MHKGKKYVDSAKTIDRSKQYEPAEALSTVVSTAKAKFDETIELHVKLGVDSRHADQQVRGAREFLDIIHIYYWTIYYLILSHVVSPHPSL